MPYDLETFKNLYPYPLKDQFRQKIEKQILSGELKIPNDRVLDSKLWIEEETSKQYNQEKSLWNKSLNSLTAKRSLTETAKLITIAKTTTT